MSNKQLSENEIWDDSALVQSWNEALEEYKVNYILCVSQSRAYYAFFQRSTTACLLGVNGLRTF